MGLFGDRTFSLAATEYTMRRTRFRSRSPRLNRCHEIRAVRCDGGIRSVKDVPGHTERIGGKSMQFYRLREIGGW